MTYNPKKGKAAEPTKPFGSRSLVTQSWAWLTGFSAFILAILWVLQFALFTPFYQSLRRREVEKSGRVIVEAYENNIDFTEQLSQFAFSQNLRILLIDSEGWIIGNFDGFGNMFSLGGGRAEFSRAEFESCKEFFMNSKKSEFSYVVSGNGGGRAVYIAKVSPSPAGDRFLYVGSPIPPNDTTASVMARQFMIITVLLMLLSAAMAWLLSKRISQPILRLTKSAKDLAKGAFSAKASSRDYTEIVQLTEELTHATEELNKAERYRRELLANVSHDLKTPLTIIKFYAELLRDVSGDNPEKRTVHCEKIVEESDRLTEMVNELLEVSKLEQTERIDLEPLRLDRLIRGTADRFNALQEREGMRFELSVEDNVTVQGKKDLLERAVYNLIANAVRFAGDSKCVWIRLFTIESGDRKTARAEIIDAGPGIPQEELPHIWERYYKSSQPHQRGITGSGLGLSIVKTALVLHRASFGASSQAGKGSTFWFELPTI